MVDIKAWIRDIQQMDSNDEAHLRARLVGLLFECPRGGNPEYCPLFHVRQLPVAKRYEWLKSLTLEQLKNGYIHHLCCLEKNERRS